MDAEPQPPPDAGRAADRSLPRATTPPITRQAEPDSMFARVGGEDFFRRLVDGFYARVATDEVLRPLYPDEDLTAANERLRLFLIQYWGGPSTYSEQRGHPRLRMRHAPFPVGTVQIERWLTAMRAALDEVAPAPAEEVELWAYFERAAHFMRNVDG